MVLSAPTTARTPALVIPDEQTWTMAGRDPALLGVEPTLQPAAIRRVLLPDRVPRPLAGPVSESLEALPRHADTIDAHLSLPGDVETRHLQSLHEGEHEPHDEAEHEHDGHEHGGHDHADMMAIVGEPSSDGLVMEPIQLSFGPTATPLPSGLVADVELDGDVVAAAEVRALLVADGEVPDPLAPRAWALATTIEHEIATASSAASPEEWRRLAAVEVERALSHTAWLRAYARILGWSTLVEQCTRAVSSVIAAQWLDTVTIGEARDQLHRLAGFLQDSRGLRQRTAGRAHVSLERARELELRGPAGRASGVLDDARSDDPLYRRLGFEPLVAGEGDALARTLLRASEAVAALDIAGRALGEAAGGAPADAPTGVSASVVVEGPRGPLRAWNGQLDAPGEAAALVAAGDVIVGAEWAAALVGLASFDLSPWRVT
jgi:Respiratory-chain NADH dehydrogenase, 49 Kd subunit